jgi:hypothetical protein
MRGLFVHPFLHGEASLGRKPPVADRGTRLSWSARKLGAQWFAELGGTSAYSPSARPTVVTDLPRDSRKGSGRVVSGMSQCGLLNHDTTCRGIRSVRRSSCLSEVPPQWATSTTARWLHLSPSGNPKRRVRDEKSNDSPLPGLRKRSLIRRQSGGRRAEGARSRRGVGRWAPG